MPSRSNDNEISYRKGFGVSTFSIKPAASILSMIFCFDLAWRTRLAYVPAEAMNLRTKMNG